MILGDFFKILCAYGRKIIVVLALPGSGNVHLRVESQCSVKWSGLRLVVYEDEKNKNP